MFSIQILRNFQNSSHLLKFLSASRHLSAAGSTVTWCAVQKAQHHALSPDAFDKSHNLSGRRVRLLCGSKMLSVFPAAPALCVGAKTVVKMTISADMVNLFAKATGDWNPIHFGEEHLSSVGEGCEVEGNERIMRKEGKAPIVHGALLNGIVSGVMGTHFPGPGTVVVSQAYSFPAALHVGNEVSIEIDVMNLRRREVNVKYKVVSVPDGTLVMDGTARLMVPKGRIVKVS